MISRPSRYRGDYVKSRLVGLAANRPIRTLWVPIETNRSDMVPIQTNRSKHIFCRNRMIEGIVCIDCASLVVGFVGWVYSRLGFPIVHEPRSVEA